MPNKKSASASLLSSKPKFSKQFVILLCAVLAAFGVYYVLATFASTKVEAYSYGTTISKLSGGTVTACQDEKRVYMKAASSSSGTTLSYWFDSKKASNKTVKTNTTTYVDVSIGGTNFSANIFPPNMGGYGPADFAVTKIGPCIPSKVTFSADGCQVTATGPASYTFEWGSFVGQAGGSATTKIPSSGTITKSSGGNSNSTSFGNIKSSKGTLLASSQKKITASQCPPADTK